MALAIPHPAAGSPNVGETAPHCPRCDYMLANIPEDRCPECGLGYSLPAIEHVEHFITTGLVRDYQRAMRWSISGLIVAGLPLILPRPQSGAFLWVVAIALLAPVIVGAIQSLLAFAHEWALPRWVWFSPMIGALFVSATMFQALFVLIGLGASGLSALTLLRTASIPAVLAPLDSRAGRRLRQWQTAAWLSLASGLLLQLSLVTRIR